MSISDKVRYGDLYIKDSNEYILHRFYTDSIYLKDDNISLTDKLIDVDNNISSIENSINTIEEGFVFINDNNTAVLNTSKVTTASFSDNQLKVSSTYFTLALDGTVNISAGTIGGWTIGKKSLYYNTDSIGSTTVGTYLGTDGIYQYASDKTYLYIVSGNIEQQYGSSNMVYLERGKITIEDISTGILTEYTNNGIALYENEQLIGDIGIYKIDGITSLRLRANYSNEIVFYWNTDPVYYMDYSSDHNGHVTTHSFIGGINAETSVRAESYLKSGTYASIGSYLTTGTYANIGSYLTVGTYIKSGSYITSTTYIESGTYVTASSYVRVNNSYGNARFVINSSKYIGIYNDTLSRWILRSEISTTSSNNGQGVTRLIGANVSDEQTGCSIRLATANDVDGSSTTDRGVWLHFGADSDGKYMRSYTVHQRKYSSSSATTIGITSSGTFGRITSSSSRYKNSIIALTNPENTTQTNIKKSDCINGSGSILVNSDDLKDGFIDSDSNENNVSNELENSSDYDYYTEDALSLLKLPVSLFKYNEGYVDGEHDFDYGKYILGFIAEDVESICSDCVIYNREPVFETDEDGNIITDEEGCKEPIYEKKTDEVESWSEREMIPRIVFILQYQQKLIEDQAEEIEKLKANFN